MGYVFWRLPATKALMGEMKLIFFSIRIMNNTNKGSESMYEHTFRRVELSAFNKKPKEDYQQIVFDFEKEGWELVQIFAPALRVTARLLILN